MTATISNLNHLCLEKREIFLHEGAEHEVSVYISQDDGCLYGHVSRPGDAQRVVAVSGGVAEELARATDKDPGHLFAEAIKLCIKSGEVRLG